MKKVSQHIDSAAASNSWIAAVLPPAVLVFLTTIIYYPSLNYPFQFDDVMNIAKRFAIRFDAPLDRWFTHTRWFGDLLNSLNYQIGGFDPFWYRVFNLGIHLSAGLAVFYLTYSLCSMSSRRRFLQEQAGLISFVTSGLFLLHPVQTQTVSYVIQARQEGLASLFVLLTLLAYVRTLMAKTTLQRVVCGVLFVLAAVLARGTKELVIALPFLIMLVEWFFVAQEDWQRFKKRFFIGLAIAGLVLAAVLYQHSWSFIRDAITMNASTVNNRGNILTPNPYDIITPWMFLISEFRVLIHYIAIFFWPFDISVEYDWKIAPGFFTAQVIIPGVMLLAIALFIIYSLMRKKNSLTVFGLLWFFIVIAPRASIIPSAELVCDYKTYLASYGILLMMSGWLVTGMYALRVMLKEQIAWFSSPQMQMAFMTACVGLLGIGAYERNKVWSNPVDFWADNAKKAPEKARVHNNQGVALSESGRYKESLECYFRAIKLDGYYADPYSNLAVAYSMLNEIDKAIDALRNAIHIYPDYPEAYNNLGTLLIQKGKHKEAEEALRAAVDLRGYYGKAHYNLARLYEEQGLMEKSWTSLKAAVEGDLDIPEAYFKLGQLSLKMQKYAEAVSAFQWVINHGEGQDQVWFNLANSFYMLGEQEKAKEIYERLAKNNPLDGRYIYNLGEAYFAKNEYEKALLCFQKAVSLPQPIAQSFFRVAVCLEQLNKLDEARSFLQQLTTAEATDEFKKALNSEIGRLELKRQVQAGNGTITLTQLKNTLSGKIAPVKQS